MPADYQLTSKALNDLDGIWSYIAAENPDAANRVEAAILDACEVLGRHPRLGSRRAHLTQRPVRFWPVTRFPNIVVVYRPDTKPIRVIRVLHARRDMAKILLGR